MVDRCVEQVDAADDVVRVVEALDEVAQALGRVGGEVVDVRGADPREDPFDGVGVNDRALHELRACRNVLAETASEIVEHVDLMAAGNQCVGDVRPNEPGRAGNLLSPPLRRAPPPARAARAPWAGGGAPSPPLLFVTQGRAFFPLPPRRPGGSPFPCRPRGPPLLGGREVGGYPPERSSRPGSFHRGTAG